MGNSDDASFVQGVKPPSERTGSAPASSVMPVARKASGTFAPSPRERFGRIVISLVEHALAAHEQAAEARADGDEAGAELLRDAAERAWALASNAVDEIAALQ